MLASSSTGAESDLNLAGSLQKTQIGRQSVT